MRACCAVRRAARRRSPAHLSALAPRACSDSSFTASRLDKGSHLLLCAGLGLGLECLPASGRAHVARHARALGAGGAGRGPLGRGYWAGATRRGRLGEGDKAGYSRRGLLGGGVRHLQLGFPVLRAHVLVVVLLVVRVVDVVDAVGGLRLVVIVRVLLL